jgi:sugar transferase (PEP-CTERM/EpsH1 system associated)
VNNPARFTKSSRAPLRLVHVVHWLRVAGLENGVTNLVNRLGEDVVQTVVCVREAGPLSLRLPPHVRLIVVGRKDKRDVGLLWRLARLFRQLRPHIVHSRNWATIDAVPAARLAGVPFVIHGEHGREASDPEGRNRRRNSIEWMLSPLVSSFVTVSEDLSRWLVTTVGVSADKVVCIPNGVDTTAFSEPTYDSVTGQRSRRLGLGLQPQSIVVGTVGRLDPVKDHLTLLEAFARLSDPVRNLELVIAGEGPLRVTLERRIEKLELTGRVHLLGHRNDVPAVLREIDLFVLPSLAEGMSNTVLEAMATGLPVVATRTGGTPELVVHGVTGTLVPVGDAAALAAALEVYRREPHLRELHGKAGRQRAVEDFSVDRMVCAYRNLYLGLAGRPER